MAADQLTDKEDQFKRRARRRLVGAVALVLLMVTVLPMVLDDRSGQKSPQPEIAISIPSQDGKEFTSRIVPVVPQVAETAPISMTSPVEKPVQPTATSAKSADAPKPPAANKPETKPATPGSRPVEKVAEPATVQPAKEKKPVRQEVAKTENKGKATDLPTTVRKGSISVQIGVFSDAAKVKQMRAKIAEKDVNCYTENMNTPKGIKYRVRCGPYPDKTGAQQALDTLKASGYNGILVTNQ